MLHHLEELAIAGDATGVPVVRLSWQGRSKLVIGRAQEPQLGNAGGPANNEEITEHERDASSLGL
jgi:hypothetical protein